MLSDFLSGRSRSLPITDSLIDDPNGVSLVEKASNAEDASSDSALWMLLLLRLTTVTTDERLDLRNSKSPEIIFCYYANNSSRCYPDITTDF